MIVPHCRPLFTCLAWTGARPNELFALRWKDVDFKRGAIRINKGRFRGSEDLPKTASSSRIVPMLSVVRAALEQVKKQNTMHLDGYVFTTKSGQPIDKHLDHVWRTGLRKARLRHRPSISCATHSLHCALKTELPRVGWPMFLDTQHCKPHSNTMRDTSKIHRRRTKVAWNRSSLVGRQ